jgi:hypothetical protein
LALTSDLRNPEPATAQSDPKREDRVDDNVDGGVQVQVHVKVNAI